MFKYAQNVLPGPIAQSVASLTADPGVAISIRAWSHTFVDIDLEMISMVILLLQLFQKECCQLQVKVWVKGKSVVK